MSQPFSFDPLARAFDTRAGLPADAARAVAGAVAGLAGGPVVDVGAGTGEIGTELARRGPYVGLDVSLGMLAVFRRKAPGASLAAADAERPWPLADACAGTVFLSRAAHLLDPEHLVHEALRVVRPGGVIVFGRVRRDEESVRQLMRRRMHELLREHGVEGRRGRRQRDALLERLADRGAERLPLTAAASWTVAERPADSLDAWRAKDGLAGRALDDTIRRDVLERLETWARERCGDLGVARESRETYELAAVRVARERTRGT